MKLCNRNYSEHNMYSLKEINGVQCCPSCEKPAQCHGMPIDSRALYWALSGDTGISSETIAAFMTNSNASTRMRQPPSDASDRGRCIRLLELIPEWIARLPEMVALDKKPANDGIVISSSGISTYSNSWAEQIPLIMKEGSL
jgi:hypothetical protein